MCGGSNGAGSGRRWSDGVDFKDGRLKNEAIDFKLPRLRLAVDAEGSRGASESAGSGPRDDREDTDSLLLSTDIWDDAGHECEYSDPGMVTIDM